MVRRAEDAGADALELNFGCPHGMSERGMGSAVGQVPEYTEMITAWVKEAAKTPVIVKLTPNVTDITRIALAAERGGADAVSLINTINSLMGVDLETFVAAAERGRKILARRLLRAGGEADRAAPGFERRENGEDSDRGHRRNRLLERRGRTHRAGCVDRAGLHRGDALRIPHRRRHDRRPLAVHGRSRISHHRGFSRARRAECEGLGRPRPELQNHRRHSITICASAASSATSPARTARTSASSRTAGSGEEKSERMGVHVPRIIEDECVGCNLCALVCPVDQCITMKEVDSGLPPVSWNERVRQSAASCTPPMPSGD